MAHDRQYKDNESINSVVCGRFDCPKKGDRYWNRYTRRQETATEDLKERFIILEEKR